MRRRYRPRIDYTVTAAATAAATVQDVVINFGYT